MDIAIVRQVQPIFINKVKMTVAGQNNTPEPKKIPISITTIPTIKMDGITDTAIVRQVQPIIISKVKMTVAGQDTTPGQKKIPTCIITIPTIKMDGIMDICIVNKKHFSCACA